MSGTAIKDPKEFGRVAVLMGGPGSEREVSLDSARNVLSALNSQGVDATAVDGVPALIAGLQARRFDRVFNILHGGDGENGVVQGLLEALRIPYTGAGVLGAALTLDKIRTKQIWQACGLPTPSYRHLAPGADVRQAAGALGLPVVIKPSLEGSSVGISRVFDAADLPPALALAQRYGGELLIERLIEGEEYTVGILGEEALPTIRIVPAGEYYDYHAKYLAEDTRYICPGLSGDAEARMQALALAAFRAAGCSGWGRVDIMRDRAGENFLLEINTTPGMTSHSLVPKAAQARGMTFERLVWRILETSSGRPAGGMPGPAASGKAGAP
jgi:D-alanine-D-alanine ligase